MLALIVLGLLACTTLGLVLHALPVNAQDEPQELAVGIPYVTHAWGIVTKKSDYLLKLHQRFQLPIYTLQMPFVRMYVVNQPNLIHHVQRHTNAVAFGPIGRDFGFLFSGLTSKSQDTIKKSGGFKANGDYLKDAGYAAIIHKFMQHKASAEKINHDAATSLAYGMEGWSNISSELNLLSIIRHQMTIAMTDALYGPQNPFRNSTVEAGWQDFLPGISKIVLGIFPSVTARKSLEGRARVVEAFERYYAEDGHLGGSSMIRSTYNLALSYPLPFPEIAKMDIATCLALLSSGAITTFWLLFHIYSSPEILRDCRKELLQLAQKAELINGGLARKIDLSLIKPECPVLHSTLQEVFRFHSTIISAKLVMDDVYIADQYLLKKGSLLMIPGPVLHKDPSTWGSTAHQFDHQRFRNMGRTPTANFRPFGVGETMCPGRHFSINLILSFAAMMLLQYNIAPKDGIWKMPTKENADLWNTMPKPDFDIPVTVMPRNSDEKGDQYRFYWSASANETCSE